MIIPIAGQEIIFFTPTKRLNNPNIFTATTLTVMHQFLRFSLSVCVTICDNTYFHHNCFGTGSFFMCCASHFPQPSLLQTRCSASVWLLLGWRRKKKIRKQTTMPSFFSPTQDCEGLPDVSWPPADLAAEHGREAQQQKVLHWVSNVSRTCSCPCSRISQHAGGSQVPACWQRHLPGREYKHGYTRKISE